MKIIIKGKIDAPIEHVFNCLTDIAFYKSEMKYDSKNHELGIKLQYDRKDPFGVGKILTFLRYDEPIFTIKVTDQKPPTDLNMELTLTSDVSDVLGSFHYTARLNSLGKNETEYLYTYTSSKNPQHLITKFIGFIAKLSVSFSFKKANKRFISYVKKTNI